VASYDKLPFVVLFVRK